MEIAIIYLWVGSIFCGMAAGSGKDAPMLGAALGLLFGPVGAIAALGLDGRKCCPACGGRMDTYAAKCQHCGAPLKWEKGNPKLRPMQSNAPRPRLPLLELI